MASFNGIPAGKNNGDASWIYAGTVTNSITIATDSTANTTGGTLYAPYAVIQYEPPPVAPAKPKTPEAWLDAELERMMVHL